jgi:endogenous inhibitor of DNA gyrase (YacG/DUF329 family)
MTVSKRVWLGLVGLFVVVGLPLMGSWARRQAAGSCALDGMAIDPVYRVEVVDARGQPHPFCCLRCAQMWLDRQQARPLAITVTDEVSGRPIDAAAAWFVSSSVVTMPTTGNRIHAFGTRHDAEKHAASFAGSVLPESEYPFPR